jgi:hypothetical protein
MGTSANSFRGPTAIAVDVTEDVLVVELSDGRTLSVPVAWNPRLEHATHDERTAWMLVGGGTGIHWDAIDEDVSVEALVAGRASNESQASLRRWLAARGSVD